MESIDEINEASRDDLVAYLEGWGFQCYDHESTAQLRAAAIDSFETEGPGHGANYGETEHTIRPR